jgi:hypothetical protein
VVHAGVARRRDAACRAELRRGLRTTREHRQDGVVVGADARLHDSGNATVELVVQ